PGGLSGVTSVDPWKDDDRNGTRTDSLANGCEGLVVSKSKCKFRHSVRGRRNNRKAVGIGMRALLRWKPRQKTQRIAGELLDLGSLSVRRQPLGSGRGGGHGNGPSVIEQRPDQLLPNVLDPASRRADQRKSRRAHAIARHLSASNMNAEDLPPLLTR